MLYDHAHAMRVKLCKANTRGVTNNAAEYEALINGLRIAVELGTMRLYVRDDLELVIDQVMKESSCKSPFMVAYCQDVRKLEDKL